MKICLQCKKSKEVTEFYKNKKSKDGFQSWCKSCHKEYFNKKYIDNSGFFKRYKSKRIEEIKSWVWEIKSQFNCEKCGEDHPAALDFHHNNPEEKELSISLMAKWGFSKENILQEMKKCNVWCSNCHRKYHWEKSHEKL